MSEEVQPPLPSPSVKNALTSTFSPIQKKQMQSRQSSWLEQQAHHARGERALWVAVITQAMQDAQSRCKKAESIFQKHEATHWLTGNSRDFIDVCLCAGMDPDYVRRKAKHAISNPRPWRAEAGKGKRYLERKAYRQRLREEAVIARQQAKTPTVINGPWATK